ncbi:alkanesulfonate monooxygenase SsuD/methylene tetrahydromethanopterin reductase-like flavin-dependent oxidoreductase (luciferase family) [Thermosporothrix hazakensis]|jgi:alkanesulfonate monooxygenase SsuD/methylene tetrahydromethanopterin reductase-like flavin-dependent oxidoreductase (luciferase family)|uniref:Alkanesulfonate monooxygenase SsuD/methylene tetrahydromethanopterin reductase-like flavin-dependent oxidoreductase (Luciferase family) n=1 Tax=Thermosporothrix hazakensis TaxID=644383 RepID=A0A326U7S6_THEHA|nr:LLM class flavin-dependent oxidoreductase [Thermosporothrix hazakensis]PZW29235.1 alkanesulfonate monooxygenase SsuD/methylene tetrahydromethanopterin reductase-like flavin-dependent oxidoreductase (luciferase family) [Thermosporothrix hazakensis]GCE45412.1 hypothetical protein KTH_02810 [Thermosporothrix hazakensis]
MYRTATLPLQFGINVDPAFKALDLAFDLAQLADERRLDFIGIQDHPYNGRFLDTWTLVSYLAARTRHVRFITNVANLPLRPPAILAKSFTTLDHLTEGRFEPGIGAGAFQEGITSYGGPKRTPGEAVEALEEAIHIFQLLWYSEPQKRVSFEGRFYSLRDAEPGPFPTRPLPIWVGGIKPRMLRLIGRLADGLMISHNWVEPKSVPQIQETLDESAQQAGRDINSIRRLYNLLGVIVGPKERIHAKQPGFIVGTEQEWAEWITHFYTELALDSFIFWPIAGNYREQCRCFINEVIPRVKEYICVVPQEALQRD